MDKHKLYIEVTFLPPLKGTYFYQALQARLKTIIQLTKPGPKIKNNKKRKKEKKKESQEGTEKMRFEVANSICYVT